MSSYADPAVSIVIPCYNAGPLVGEAIESALAQTHPNCEIIVIDDGSTDRSLDVIRSFHGKIRWETGPRMGACAARNRGIELAEGQLVKFLDADDILLAEAVVTQIAQIRGLPAHAIPYGQVLDYETRTPVYDRIRTSLQTTRDEMVLECFRRDILIAAPLHRKNALLAIKGFDPKIQRGQEWNLHIRLALNSIRFVFFEVPVACYRAHLADHRLSRAASGTRALDVHVARYLRTAAAVSEAYAHNIPLPLKTEIFVRLNHLGRTLARVADRKQATTVLAEAERFSVSTQRIGRLPYRWLRMLVGGYAAERMLEALRRARAKLGACGAGGTGDCSAR